MKTHLSSQFPISMRLENPTVAIGLAWGKDSVWDGRNRCSLTEIMGCILADRTERAGKVPSKLLLYRWALRSKERGSQGHILEGRGYEKGS